MNIKDDFAFFLPTRKDSERVKNKNTRQFADIEGGLLALKIHQLLKVERVGEIVISTNDPQTVSVAKTFFDDRIVIIPRPEELCLSSTIIEEFINYIPTIVKSKHIFWVHTTAPFVSSEVYNRALDVYIDDVLLKKTYDSLMSVTKLQQFLWCPRKNECINYDRRSVKWPRTQDLEPVYEINHAFYINSFENYKKYSDRIGERPCLFELNKIESFDIDWEDDFKLAEYMYKSRCADV